MLLRDTDRIAVPDNVLVRELDGESVLLDISTEAYYGLDETGSRMWQALVTGPDVGAAFAALLAEYEVEADRLRHDLAAFVGRLAELGLLHVQAG